MVADVQELQCRVAGVKTKELARFLLYQTTKLQPWLAADTSAADRLAAAMCLLGEMAPKTGTEAMLAVQMIGVHNAATMFLARATPEGQTFEGADADMRRATRLMHLFNQQLEAMARLKGKTGQQKVIVEHVHIHDGGQAIVGAVSASKRPSETRREGDA